MLSLGRTPWHVSCGETALVPATLLAVPFPKCLVPSPRYFLEVSSLSLQPDPRRAAPCGSPSRAPPGHGAAPRAGHPGLAPHRAAGTELHTVRGKGWPGSRGGTRGQGTPPPLTPAPSSPLQSLAPTPLPRRAPVPEPSRRSSRDCGTWRAAPPSDTSPPCPSCLTCPPCCKDALHRGGGGGQIVPGGPRAPQGCPMVPGVATDPRHRAGLWERGPSSFGGG